MQAVILAAGKGTRAWPLTQTRPKALLKVGNKTILEHNLKALESLVDEIIIVIGYLGKEIENFFSNYAFKAFKDKIKLIYQINSQKSNTANTALALFSAKNELKDRFLVINGDDIYSKNDLENLISKDYGVLIYENKNKEINTSTTMDFFENLDGKLVLANSDFINTGAYALTKDFFNYLDIELGLPGSIVKYSSKNSISVEKVKDFWIPINYSWDLLRANKFLLMNNMIPEYYKYYSQHGFKFENVFVGNNVLIDDVKFGLPDEHSCYAIIGDGSRIGPFALIRSFTSIGDGCRIQEFCTIKNSILFDGAIVAHRAYVGDSIIGSNVNISDGAACLNTRVDKDEVFVYLNGEKTNTGLKKFGAVIGDEAFIGGGVKLNPGTLVPAKAQVIYKKGEIVYRTSKKEEWKKL